MDKYHCYEKKFDEYGNLIQGLYITTVYSLKDMLNLSSYMKSIGKDIYTEQRDMNRKERAEVFTRKQ